MRRKKKKRRSRSRSRSKSRSDEEDIDDEDRELLKENLGITIQKKRKRIRMESGSEDGSSDNENDNRGDDIPDLEGEGGESGNESDDFIVGADGRPIRSEKKKKKKHLFADEERQLAEDIFGVKFDYGEFEQYEDDEAEEDYEEEDEDDEEAAAKFKKKKKKRAKTIFELYEPSELEMRHFTDHDNEIRNTDIPERMQLRNFPVTKPDEADQEELDHEAEWIFNRFTKATVSKQDLYSDREITEWNRRKEAVIEKIRNALFNIRCEFFEVPFINFYRKEYVQPELKINDLWRVYYLDEEWCKLQSRKKSLKKLYEHCKAYQEETILADMAAEIPKDVRLVQGRDLERIDAITNFEELKDMEQLFKLYYSRDRDAIKTMLVKKRKEERETKKMLKKIAIRDKKAKRKKTKVITNDEGEEIEVTDDEAEDDEAEEDNEDEEEDAEEDEDEEIDEEILKHANRNDPVSFCKRLGIAGTKIMMIFRGF